ncbi:MAG: hypothetical protein GY898_26035 [Proteobacteria bacterium]|nr:hypothetical protein [Pseudomonadota bacterium]
MAETDKVAWLVASDGTLRRIGPQPLLLGRGLGCEALVHGVGAWLGVLT